MSVQIKKAVNTSLLSGHILLLSCLLILILGMQSIRDLRLSNFSGTRQTLWPQDGIAIAKNFSICDSPLLLSLGQKLFPISKALLKIWCTGHWIVSRECLSYVLGEGVCMCVWNLISNFELTLCTGIFLPPDPDVAKSFTTCIMQNWPLWASLLSFSLV